MSHPESKRAQPRSRIVFEATARCHRPKETPMNLTDKLTAIAFALPLLLLSLGVWGQ